MASDEYPDLFWRSGSSNKNSTAYPVRWTFGVRQPGLSQTPGDSAQTFIRDRTNMKGDEALFTIPRELAGAVRDFTLREGATVMVLLAAYRLLYHSTAAFHRRHTGCRTAGLGTVPACGIVRNTLSCGPTFSDLLPSAHWRPACETALSFEHQHVPFRQCCRCAKPERASVSFLFLSPSPRTPCPDPTRPHSVSNKTLRGAATARCSLTCSRR